LSIITSKTDEAIRNEFNRRGFLKLAGSAGFGVTLYSALGKTSIAVMPPGARIPAGYRGFWDAFKGFALSVGMQAAGYGLNQAFNRYPSLQTGYNNFTRGANGYNPLQGWDMMTGLGRTFIPMQNPNNGLFMSPFFFPNNGNLGSPINWWSNLALPQVNDLLVDQSLSQGSRADYLLPVSPRSGSSRSSYNNVALPERYNTEPGSTEFKHKGDSRAGEVDYKIYVKRDEGTLEELKKSGTMGVEIEA
jgi:hypothetical protein